MKIAVMGAGAVGGYCGALLARAGHDVCLIARPAHVEAINARGGLRLDSKAFSGVVPLAATSDPAAVASADLVLVVVKSTDTETAAGQMAPHLSATTPVLSLQNGVDNAKRLGALLGRAVIPAAVYVASEVAGPGHIRHLGRGELILGPSDHSDALARMFSDAAIPTTVSAAVREALWQKLTINCAYNALSAIPRLNYARMFAVEGTAEVMRAVVGECVAVAAARGIRLPDDMLAQTLALHESMPAQQSSTAQDFARGRPSEINHLNGTIVRAGRELGIPTPANLTLLTLVKLCEAAMTA